MISQKLRLREWEQQTESKLGEENYLDVWDKLIDYRNQEIDPSMLVTSSAKERYVHYFCLFFE